MLNVQVPFFFKSIIDALNVPVDPTTPNGVFVVAGTVIVGCKPRRSTWTATVQGRSTDSSSLDQTADGLARVGAAAFSELRNAVFASVAQQAIRRVARNVFTHLLSLDIGFHLTRQTGGLTRAIDRGTK